MIAFLSQIDDIGGCSTQEITWQPIADHTIEETSFNVSATSSSGLPVSFSVLAGPASIIGNEVQLDGLPGVVILSAQQAGDATFCPASQVTQSFQVTSDCEGVLAGTYQLINEGNGKTIDANTTGNQVSQRTGNASLNEFQQWEISPLNNGFFKIRNIANQLVLGINNASDVGSPILQETDDATNILGQQWSVCISENGSFQLLNRHSNLVFYFHASAIDGAFLRLSPVYPE